MFQKFFGFLVLTGALVLVTPDIGLAQRGGGHGGGGHFAGGDFGGYGSGHYAGHYGGAHYGYGGGHYGAYRYGYPYYRHGYHHYRPSYGYYGYYPYYGLYGNYYPYYGPYGSYGDYYGSYPDLSASPTSDVAPDYGNDNLLYPPVSTTAPANTSAHVTVTVPEDALLSFDGKATTSTGPVRQFDSPPLKPGSRYTYEIRARWNEDGHDVTQTQKVTVTAGAHVNVDFPVPPAVTRQPSTNTKG
jgi:uncharacterized protein (TIGR03000 family)